MESGIERSIITIRYGDTNKSFSNSRTLAEVIGNTFQLRNQFITLDFQTLT